MLTLHVMHSDQPLTIWAQAGTGKHCQHDLNFESSTDTPLTNCNWRNEPRKQNDHTSQLYLPPQRFDEWQLKNEQLKQNDHIAPLNSTYDNRGLMSGNWKIEQMKQNHGTHWPSTLTTLPHGVYRKSTFDTEKKVILRLLTVILYVCGENLTVLRIQLFWSVMWIFYT